MIIKTSYSSHNNLWENPVPLNPYSTDKSLVIRICLFHFSLGIASCDAFQYYPICKAKVEAIGAAE